MPPAFRLAALLISRTLSISNLLPSSQMIARGVTTPSGSNFAITSDKNL